MRHTYREYPPAPGLRPYVECYWQATSDGSPGFRPIELLVPDLKVELIVNAGQHYLWAPGPAAERAVAPAFACLGMRATSLAISQAGALDHFSIRLRPAGLAAFTRLPLSELTQRCVDAAELLGAEGRALAERIALARSTGERVAQADRFLLARVRAPGDAGLARSCVRALLRSGGTATIAAIAGDHGVGYKRLERAFAQDVGLTPKHVAKVARLQRALQGARGPAVDLAALALDMGYADQAHMTRDFQRLVGRPPRAFFAERFAVFETMQASGSIGLRLDGPG